MTGLQTNLKDEGKTKEELSKRQLEQLLEQYVSSCVKKMVTTASPVQEEVKAQDVVSALKNVPKGNRKNFQAGYPKNVRTPGAAQGRGKRVQQTKKGNGKGKGKPKNESKGKGQGTAVNKSQTKSSGKGKKNTSKGQGPGKGKKKRKNGGKTGGKSKGQKKNRRPGDPFVLQSHAGSNDARLAIAVRLPEHQGSHLLLESRNPLC